MNDMTRARQTASMISTMHNCPAYIYRRTDNNEIVICIAERKETWLDQVSLTLIEIVDSAVY